ncbi:MAG: hypothetical protein Q9181_006669 [Wetmoreana brouardii]
MPGYEALRRWGRHQPIPDEENQVSEREGHGNRGRNPPIPDAATTQGFNERTHRGRNQRIPNEENQTQKSFEMADYPYSQDPRHIIIRDRFASNSDASFTDPAGADRRPYDEKKRKKSTSQPPPMQTINESKDYVNPYNDDPNPRSVLQQNLSQTRSAASRTAGRKEYPSNLIPNPSPSRSGVSQNAVEKSRTTSYEYKEASRHTHQRGRGHRHSSNDQQRPGIESASQQNAQNWTVAGNGSQTAPISPKASRDHSRASGSRVNPRSQANPTSQIQAAESSQRARQYHSRSPEKRHSPSHKGDWRDV